MDESKKEKPVAAVLAAMTLASTLAGCATPYQGQDPGGPSGGVGPGHLERVDFAGNGSSEPGQVKVFALYRAAERARQKHARFFVLYEGLLAASRNQPAQMPRVGTIGGKPWAYAFVRFSDRPVPGAHDAAEVLRLYADAVKAPAPVQP